MRCVQVQYTVEKYIPLQPNDDWQKTEVFYTAGMQLDGKIDIYPSLIPSHTSAVLSEDSKYPCPVLTRNFSITQDADPL
jgi:hypothetical protein